MALRRPRQWGAGWLGCQLWEQLGLGGFWRDKLTPGREGTRWDQVLQTLVLYRLIDPGSEWRRHRHWFEHTAIADLLGGDFALAEIHRLYECHDKLVAHKAALFDHLTARWRNLFDAKFEVLLYDLTSTYFESDPPADPADPRRFGYSREQAGPAPTCASRAAHWGQGSALSSRPKASRSLTKCCPATPPTRPRSRTSSPKSKSSMAKPSASGSWTRHPHGGNSRPKARQRSARELPRRHAQRQIEKFAAVQMIDVHLPTTDGREIVMARHTQPEQDLQLLLDQLKLELPEQGPPRIQALK